MNKINEHIVLFFKSFLEKEISNMNYEQAFLHLLAIREKMIKQNLWKVSLEYAFNTLLEHHKNELVPIFDTCLNKKIISRKRTDEKFPDFEEFATYMQKIR